MTEIRICHLYPDNMNIYGDRGNIAVLTKRLEWRGHSASVTKVGIGDPFIPNNFDLCYLGGGQDKDQNLICLLYTSQSPRDKRQAGMACSG